MNYQSAIKKTDYVPMSEAQREAIEDKLDDQLKDAALWFGGFDKLRERITMLEENQAERAFERSQQDY